MSFSQEQLRNAGIIYNVGRQMGLGTRDIQIALITAMVESNLVNVHYGDSDSLGLFQQRPSQGWGTPEQVLNPTYAAHKFFSTMKSMLHHRRFQMGMGEVAQAVQRSAYPGRYAERIAEMRNLWPHIQGAGGDIPLTMEGTPFLPQLQEPLTPSIEQMVGSTQPAQQAVPDASAMLGAWGMNSPQIPEEVDPTTSGLSSLISEGTTQITQQSFGPPGFGKGVDGWRRAVIGAALGAKGTPYVWGGNSLQSGVDCSGLIQQAFARAGINLPRVSYQQANAGNRIGLKGLQPGDLVAWDNSTRNNGADHIAIYIGHGRIIESPRPGLSVRVRRLGSNEGAWGVHLNF